MKSYLGNKIPVFIVDDYTLPDFVNNKSLVFVSSYSGNTEETLECYQQAMKRGLTVVVMTNGGKLAELANQTKIPIVKIPTCPQPRLSYGYQFLCILRILENCGLVKNNKQLVDSLAVFVGIQREKIKSRAKELAKKLVNKIPIIYGSKNMEAAAYKWKININENAKTTAFGNVFPEHNHNELNGLLKTNGNLHVIFLKCKDDNIRVRKRMDVVKKLADENKIENSVIEADGNSALERIISTIYLGDWVSYFLALEYGIDPTPVELIEKFKKMLD
ncbi:MAG: bifunctional phosphoglucose/phosphomannose isomerase [Candidatus Aenigmarchaeota archaeon]|nr:bifunctional phosphoglucose/phosphomannose isomerase [Candidatus Aenigmarchaeota archaeon]